MRIAIGGDYALNDGLRQAGRDWLEGKPAPGFDALRDLFRSADLALVDFEASFSGSGPPPNPSKILIRATEEAIDVARALGIGAATLANNHVFDFGVDTRARLERAGIACCGAGDGPAHAAAPLQISIAGRETAFIGWADRSTINGVWAEDGCSGAYAAPPESLLDQVDALASRVDHVVVLPHWGRDFIKYPSPAMRELGRRLVDAGASAVVGTHPHVLGCSERHAQRPIVYSTGSLLLDDILMPDGSLAWAFVPCLSVVALIELTEDEPRVDFATFRCSRGRFEMLAPERGKARLERNSRFLGRPDYDRAYARHEARMRAWGIHLQSLRRPGATARRVGRKIARLAGSGP